MGTGWKHLQDLALEEIEATVSELPQPLRERAKLLPVSLERQPNAALRQDGIAADTLGLFVGPEYAQEESCAASLPPQIILFLENLWDLADQDDEAYRDEVRTTYLHELGHYLGLDEDDLFERGLD
jgi:predicted Zn-dependent protease with MMP-like domain